MVTRPKLLILDEPTAALPPKMAHLILEKVATEVRPRGVPVLMIEQRVTDALAIADRAYVMAKAVSLARGSPQNSRNKRLLTYSSAAERED